MCIRDSAYGPGFWVPSTYGKFVNQDRNFAVRLRLWKEGGRRAESIQRERQQNGEEKRRKRLEEIKDVLPVRMGMKWGLKWGDHIVVPPCYRNICIPVGGYCAFEGNADVYKRQLYGQGDSAA